ncbi:GAF domain-containing protein [Chondrinema litorale]|uniref:GAF domain-containing protein n=1 Tax=Chondrinema litorale TaxID=2994555 RepID=UPI002543AA8D|nr:GAF domain-containing protein [Chondrinema litorale]UZR92728.1 GAF domain-containing protein [Chondrinema litorale]
MKKVFSRFSLFTLRGKIFILVGLFIFFLIVFSSIIIFRLNRTTSINERLTELHIPIIRANKEILNAIDRNMALQRAYIITENKDIVKERELKWDTSVNTAIKDLENAKEILEADSIVQKLDSLEEYLYQYGRVQRKLDEMITNKIKKTANLQNVTDTVFALATLQANRDFSAEIGPFITNEVIELEGHIITLITTIIEEQENEMAIDMVKNDDNISYTSYLTLLIAVIAAIAGGLIARSFSVSLLKAVNKPRQLLDQLALGIIPESVEETSDELNPIILAGNQVKEMLKEASKFSIEVGNGNFKYNFKPASENDYLGNALVTMRDQLDDLAEEEQRRAWTSGGIANFAAILRSNNKSLLETCDQVLSELIKYIEANQGAIFMHNNEQPDNQYLEMVSCYAYDKKKFLEKKLKVAKKFGEGLVGQTFIEKETTVLKDVPESYVSISSGLGKQKPNFLLIVPLKLNDTVEGVLEIASFKELEGYKIEFVEKIAESLASTVSTLKSNQITQTLLIDAQEREEQFNAQEEEMRQSLEELYATQEEMSRKQGELMQLKNNLETEVVQKTQNLTKEKEAFEEIASAVPGMIFQLVFDADTQATFKIVSEGAYKLTGIEKSKFKTLNDFDALLDEESKESFKEILNTAISSGEDIEWDGCLIVGENIKWIKLLAGVNKANNEITIISGAITDISLYKEEEEKYKIQAMILEEHENENRKALEEIELHKKQVEILNSRYERASIISNESIIELVVDVNAERLNNDIPVWLSANFVEVCSIEFENLPSTLNELKALISEDTVESFTQSLEKYLLKEENTESFACSFKMKTKDDKVKEFKLEGICEKEEDQNEIRFAGVIKPVKEAINKPVAEGDSISNSDLINTYQFHLVFEKSTGKSFIKNLDEALYLKTGYTDGELKNISIEKLQEYFIHESGTSSFAEYLHICFEAAEKSSWLGKLKASSKDISVLVKAEKTAENPDVIEIKGVIIDL